MKKLRRFAVLMIAAAVLMTVPVLAAGGAIGLSADREELRPGDTVTVTVSLEENPGIAFLAVYVDYDSTVFALESREVGDLLVDNTEVPDLAGRTGFDLGDDLSTSDTTETGVVGTIVLKVLDGAANGDTTIRTAVDAAYTWDLADVDITDAALTLTVSGGAEATPVPEGDSAAEEEATPAPVGGAEDTGDAAPADARADDEAAPQEPTDDEAAPQEPTDDGQAAPAAADAGQAGDKESAADQSKANEPAAPAASAVQSSNSGLWIGISIAAVVVAAVVIVVVLRRNKKDDKQDNKDDKQAS